MVVIHVGGSVPSDQFLAWQSEYVFCYVMKLLTCICIAWDLLRICMYGFSGLCCDFLHRHPGYFISPLRLSGSAVETLFSQYKRLAGGKLDAVNYVTSRAAQLIQQTVTSHHSGSDYRNNKLDIPDIELERKKYGRCIK